MENPLQDSDEDDEDSDEDPTPLGHEQTGMRKDGTCKSVPAKGKAVSKAKAKKAKAKAKAKTKGIMELNYNQTNLYGFTGIDEALNSSECLSFCGVVAQFL